MAKNKMLNKWMNVLAMLIGVIVTFGVGGLFLNGTFLNTIILDMLPEVVHTVVGWTVIVSGALTGVLGIVKQLS
jgi:hypothetical protein